MTGGHNGADPFGQVLGRDSSRSRWAVRLLRALLMAVALVALPSVILFTSGQVAAQPAAPRMRASVDPREVTVGESFVVSLEVDKDSSGPDPSDPMLPVPAGLRAGPPSTSQSSQISIVNGRISRSSSLQISWEVVASRQGTFTIGPPSIAWNGHRMQANPLSVVVHAAGTAQPSRRVPGGRANPFDPFGMFPGFRGLFDMPSPLEPQLPVSDDPALQLDSPPDGNIFLHSVVSRPSAVVGEQVTFTVYLYIRKALLKLGREVSPSEPRLPSVPDFFQRDLLPPDPSPEQRIVNIGDTPWIVLPIHRLALFPLHAGDLPIGAMSANFPGVARGLGMRANLARSSEAVTVHVVEPPLRGRPVGYQVGDVGRFKLSATVEPRTAEVGGAIGVTATLTGTGNPPGTLRIPMQTSLEWLDPQVRETVDADENLVRGTRTFTYVVRPKSAGTMDLGTLSLPFYDPAKGAYDVARVALGTITVTPSQAPAGVDPTGSLDQDPFRAVGAVREKLGKPVEPRKLLTDRPLYWIWLLGAPFSVVLTSLAMRMARALALRLRARKQSLQRGAEQALDQARTAKGRGDRDGMSAALDRAVHLAIENATGLRARGVLLDDLPAELTRKGLSPELASELRDVLAMLEAFRFTPEGGGEDVRLLERARRVVRQLAERPARHRAGTGVAAGLLLLLALVPSPARAQGDPSSMRAPSDEPSFEQAVADMRKGDYEHAIQTFEALADQGFAHPDASYDRGLAYLGRVRAAAERPGDLGRAAAAFEEAILLRPGDRDADVALDAVRAEVARRRARTGGTAELEARPTIDRALVGLASEDTWAVLALAASLLLSIGLVLRIVHGAKSRADGLSSTRQGAGADALTAPPAGIHMAGIHVAGMIAVPIGAVLLVVFGILAWGAHHLRLTTQDGVVVARELHLTDEHGTAITGPSIPEAARVEISDQRGGLLHVRRGNVTGWASAGAVRKIVRSPM